MNNAKHETNNPPKEDACWRCGLDRRGAGAAHDCIQELKKVNKELREMLIAAFSKATS
jgi:hypothetical protein